MKQFAIRFAFSCCSLVLVALFLGCEDDRFLGTAPDGLTKKEIAFVAWWAEDVAHGGIRRADELVQPDGSPGMTRLAQWAYGRLYNGEDLGKPAIIQQRRQRWPLIAAGVQQGAIVLDEEGLPYLNTNDKETVALLVSAISAEREARTKTLTTILAVGEINPGSPAASYCADQLRDARAFHSQGLHR